MAQIPDDLDARENSTSLKTQRAAGISSFPGDVGIHLSGSLNVHLRRHPVSSVKEGRF